MRSMGALGYDDQGAISRTNSATVNQSPTATSRPNQKAKRLCTKPGCNAYALTNRSRCAAHPPHREYDSKRPEYRALYTTIGWSDMKRNQLRSHPLCAEHGRKGRVVAGSQVDHIIPHKGDLALFFDPSNLQTLCASCHSRKTAREDGGFGHAARIATNSEN